MTTRSSTASAAEEPRKRVPLLHALFALLFRRIIRGSWIHRLFLHLLIVVKQCGLLFSVYACFLDLTICGITAKARGEWGIKDIVAGMWEGFESSAWEEWEEWKFARRMQQIQEPTTLRLELALNQLHHQHQTLSSLPSHISPRWLPFYQPGFCLTPLQRSLRNSIGIYIDARLIAHRRVDTPDVQKALARVAQFSTELPARAEWFTEEQKAEVWRETMEEEYRAVQFFNFRVFLAQEARIKLSSLEPSRGRQFAPPYYSGELLEEEKAEARDFGIAIGRVCWGLRMWITAFGGRARSEWVERRIARSKTEDPSFQLPRRQPTTLELSLLQLNALTTQTHLLHPTPRPSARDPPARLTIPYTGKSWALVEEIQPDEPKSRELILSKLGEECAERDFECVWEEWRRCVVELGMARREMSGAGS